MNKKKAVVVLGMYRSGTSAITKEVIDIGAYPGTSLLEKQYDNEKGFWEDARIVSLNTNILKNFGLEWYSIENPKLNRFSLLTDDYKDLFFKDAQDIINETLF